MTAPLHRLPPFDELFAQELGGAREPIKAELLDQFWPECYEDAGGKVVMGDADAVALESLFAMFGLPLLCMRAPWPS